MDFYDEELLEAKRELERQKHTTIETGMYAGEELITFEWRALPDTNVRIPLPKSFVELPLEIRRLKYPSNKAPKFIMSSLDSTINICFRILSVPVNGGEIKILSRQCQIALENTNPSIKIKNLMNATTSQGREMNRFDYRGYQVDGSSFNRAYFIALEKSVLFGTFICQMRDKDKWMNIIDTIFMTLEEKVE